MAGPVPFRTSNENKYSNSFPSVLYYRDTFGLEPIRDSITTECSDDSVTTKSTVRTTFNINPAMNDSFLSKMTPSYHVEQILTNRVLTVHPRRLLTFTLILFATALQLLLFSSVCVFFDGCPYFVALILSAAMFVNTCILFIFLRSCPTRAMLIVSCIAVSLSCVLSISLFFWTARLISMEKAQGEASYYQQVTTTASPDVNDDQPASTTDSPRYLFDSADNPIIRSTRLAIYSFLLILAPAHAIASALAVYVLYNNVRALSDQRVVRGFFFTEPKMGHQKILVPIELLQVRQLDDDGPENASIGVQTSGTRRDEI